MKAPRFFDPEKVSEVFRVPYQERADEARHWREEHDVLPASDDGRRVGLLLVDVQNTFCIPGFELFVAGRSGTAAVDDNTRLCRFIYENLSSITRIHATLDTHTAMQIFHSVCFIDGDGEHPEPLTTITLEDVESERWKPNPRVAESIPGFDREHVVHYCRSLAETGNYELMIWPYHAMLGGVGHALVSSIEEALFFHNIVRGSQTSFEVKGSHPLTESYSVLKPEVEVDRNGRPIGERNDALVDELLSYDALIVAGQAKSHCVAWTLKDLLERIETRGPELAERVFLLEDCSSSVVVPGVVDFTEQADAAYRKFESAGMHIVRSTEPIESWAGFPDAIAKVKR